MVSLGQELTFDYFLMGHGILSTGVAAGLSGARDFGTHILPLTPAFIPFQALHTYRTVMAMAS